MESGTLDELKGEVETGPALIDGVNFGEEVVEGHRIVEFAIKWNDGQVEKGILNVSSAGSLSSLLEVLDTSVAHIAIHFWS